MAGGIDADRCAGQSVGRTLAAGLAKSGHDLMLGSRDTSRDELVDFSTDTGVRLGSPADAATHAEVLVNATPGMASEDALRAAGAADLDRTVLLDVANALDTSAGFPPSLGVANTDSLAESLQRAFPNLRVVKALNTVNCAVMVDPGSLAEPSTLFIAGDDARAKTDVTALITGFGWQPDQLVDLGGLTGARGMEAYVLLWIRLMGALGTANFNVRLVPAAR
jgi:8-hydroxy-5-deazaflavin:NADPH oxidoreductase